MSESKIDYKYSVYITVDVRRTDNAMLTDEENAMVQEMHSVAENAVAEIMAKNGQDKIKRLSKETKIY